MRYHINSRFSEKKGVVSNEHSFVNRHLDTGFKTKWSGFWTPPYKFLDYFAVKINGMWLGHESLQAVDYGERMVFHHETESLYVKEVIKTPSGVKGFDLVLEIHNKTSDPKAAHVKIETAVDIRKRDEDIPNLNYSHQKTEDDLKIKNNGKKISITSDETFNLEGESYIKTHKPGSQQKAFIPGLITFKQDLGEEEESSINLKFRTFQGDNFDKIEKIDQEFSENEFGRLFENSHSSLRNLVYTRRGAGIAAGHPWFQNFWGRDTFWSILGLIDLGYFELSKKILEKYAKKDGFPTRILLDGENEYHGGDGAPLFIIASEKLNKHHYLSEELEKKQEEALEKLEIDDEGHVVHSQEASWMDTLERPAPNVDIQSLWLEACRLLGDQEKSSLLEEGLKDFIQDKYLRDNLSDNDSKTINQVLPLLFGQLNEGTGLKVLETLNGEFSSKYGARTLSLTEPDYDPEGYHTGSVWGLTSCWAAIANFEYGNYSQATSYMSKFGDFQDENQLGALPEVVNAESGESLGCSEQAWSVGLMIHAIDSYMLGIKPVDDKVIVEPSGPVSGIRRNKRIKGSEISLRFDEGSVEVINEPEINVEVKNYDNN